MLVFDCRVNSFPSCSTAAQAPVSINTFVSVLLFGGFSVKQAFRSSCAVAASLFILCVAAYTGAQTPSPSATPDAAVAQLTSSATNAFVGDVSGDGRFVVIESTGDIATEKIPSKDAAGKPTVNPRNNEDGNREIFLLDYAQRRIFQITDTRSALKDPTKPQVAATTPTDFSNVVVEVSNNKPMISNDGRWIVFSSNAPTPGKYDGSVAANQTALQADGNQELFLYNIPAVTTVDLSSGADIPFQDLTGGAFTAITPGTPASRLPQAGTATSAPFVADDNRDATIVTLDDGNPATLDTPVVAFVSTRDIATVGKTATRNNADANPEVFIYNGTAGSILQVTDTKGGFVFNENPALSGNAAVLAFVSNSNMTSENDDDGKGNGNSEIFVARYNGTGITSLKQVTKTKQTTLTTPINVLNLGRRVSRDGTYVAFESSTDAPKTGGTIADPNTYTVFVYNVGDDTFTQVGPRPAVGSGGDIRRFPVFTDYSNTLAPGRLLFVSALNFRPDGTFPAAASAAEGLNPTNQPQIFSAPLPVPATISFTRLSNSPAARGAFPSLQIFASNTSRRTIFSEGNVEFGGGNPDLSVEAFLLLSAPTNATDAPTTTALSYFTALTERPVATASPSPTPTPSPSPTPTPDVVPGLAPGELSIIRSNAPLASSNQFACPDPNNKSCASETARRPSLPVELNGVTVAINGGAAGLYYVGNDQNQINFVVPPGLTAPTTTDNTLPIVILNNNAASNPPSVIRSRVPIVAAQPDIGSSTNGPGGRAAVTNVTNSCAGPTNEPFTVTTVRPKIVDGVCSATETETVPTVLQILLTGVRGAQTGQVTVTIGTTAITGTSITFTGQTNSAGTLTPATDTPGLDTINVALPASLSGAGDVPIVVSVTINGVTFTSRPTTDTPPHITINP
jgi:uncharacterized protein (TIGR03437 family)